MGWYDQMGSETWMLAGIPSWAHLSQRTSMRGSPAPGPHADDPRMDVLWDKCAQLGMPANIHVSDPIWSYQPMDLHNDGLMNGYTWRIDDKQPGLLGHH